MSISEDSSEGITLDLDNTQNNEPNVHMSFSGTLTDGNNSNLQEPNNLVFYLVVNPNSATKTATSEENPIVTNSLKDDNGEEQLDSGLIDVVSDTVNENANLCDSSSPYAIDDELTSAHSSQSLISGLGTDHVLDSEVMTMSDDSVLADPLSVEDPISGHLLPPVLDAENNIDDAEPKETVVSESPVIEAPKAVQTLTPGLHQVVTIGGQHFVLYTAAPALHHVTTDGTTSVTPNPPSTEVRLMLGGGGGVTEHGTEEPPAKRILLTTPVMSETDACSAASAVQPIDAPLSGTHFTTEELQEMNVIELGNTVPIEENPLVERESEVTHKPEKSAEDMDVTQTWFTSKDDKIALQNTGKTWKQGQWSKDEVEVLQDNIANYCKEHNISDPAEVIFIMNKEDRKNFYRTISRGLNRPLFSVYRRVIRMYDSTNHIGKYSPEEVEKLKALRQQYGTDWAAIGTAMGRSPSSVKDRCRLMKDQCNSGKWLAEEEKRLTAAVQRFTGMVPGESVTSGLSWAAVAEQVGTRSEKQCRTKWLNYLNWKQRGGTEWNRSDDLVLIDKIYNLCVSEENQIDWEALAENWPSARSPQWLRGKWWSLKRHVHDYQLLSFPELIDHLKTNNRTIIRANASNDNYAVKLAPMNISLNMPVTVASSGEQPEGVTESNCDNNSDTNLLPALTPDHMVEMQADGTLKIVYQQSPDPTAGMCFIKDSKQEPETHSIYINHVTSATTLTSASNGGNDISSASSPDGLSLMDANLQSTSHIQGIATEEHGVLQGTVIKIEDRGPLLTDSSVVQN